MKRRFRRIPPVVPVRALAPTIVTLLALTSGVTAVRFAFSERWEAAVTALIVAAVFDSLDGRVARLIKGETRFGAELDSLSDVICFGVVPGLILYLWTLHDLKGLGWAVVLLFCVCCALRLARFNIMGQDAEEQGTVQRYFVGVPAPGAALVALAPLALNFATDSDYFREPIPVAIFAGLLALLMVSQLRTFSFKHVRIERAYIVPVLALIVVLAALLTSYFWLTLSGIAALYLAILPFGAFVPGKSGKDEVLAESPDNTA